MASLKESIKSVATYWNKPKEGNFVSNREIAAYSGGGIGVKTVNSMVSQIQMVATCFLLGSIYKLSPRNIFILFIISNLIAIFKTPLVGKLVDGGYFKSGKFLPFLLWAGIPCIVGVIGCTWFVPLDGTPAVKMVLIGIFYNILLIGQHVYNNAYMGLAQVISPSSAERTKIMSISEFIANLGPSLVTIILPIFAGIFFGEDGLVNIMAYRILLPIFSIGGFFLGLIVMFNVKERTIVTIDIKNKSDRISMAEGLRLTFGNKYFWIINISKFFDCFKVSINVLLGWICLYQIGSSSILGVVGAITSMAFIPGMLLAPVFIKKFGLGKFGFMSWIFNALAATLMLITFKEGVVFFIVGLFIFNFFSGPQYIIQTSLAADALDYQQLKSSKRIEGFVQNVQLVFQTLGAVALNFLLVIVYEAFGLVADETGNTDYSILTDVAIREPIVTWSIIIAIVATILAALPFLFCDMTKAKHEAILTELNKRKQE